MFKTRRGGKRILSINQNTASLSVLATGLNVSPLERVAKVKLYINNDFFGRKEFYLLKLNSICSQGPHLQGADLRFPSVLVHSPRPDPAQALLHT